MTAYVIVYRETPVRNPEAIAEYSRRNHTNAALFRAQSGIVPLAAYGATQALEGAAPDGVVILQFPTIDAARRWYESPEYQEALAFRKEAADWRVVLVEGLPG